MIVAAAHAHRVLFKYAHVWRGFARVEKFGFAPLEKLRHGARVGGYAAHVLEIIQRDTLARKQHADISRHFR